MTIPVWAAWIGGLAALCALSRPVAAQTWEYSPYNIRLWIAVEHAPQILGLAEDLQSHVAQGARLASGVAWRVFPEVAPAAIHDDLLWRLDGATTDRLQKMVPDVFKISTAGLGRHYTPADGDQQSLNVDKLVVVGVREGNGGFLIQVRELDVSTRQWGDLISATVAQPEAIPNVALQLMLQSVRPIAKIERMEGRTAFARLRAGGLITAPGSPADVAAGQVLTPVVRRNGKSGEPLTNGIQAPLWSYVLVDSRTDTALSGTLNSGYGSVIPAKGGPKTERFLLGLKPRYATTRLELRARIASTSTKGSVPAGRPLAGYEVYVKDLGEEKTELLGLTDWDGSIELQPADRPLRLFYIKNGGQLLARLPLVVGQQPAITANVLDDDPRLQVESYIKSLQSRVMDLVARREILAVRIRAKLKKGDYAAAKALVTEFRNLPTNAQLARELEESQRRMSNAPGINGRRIEKLFADGHKLLQGFLDPATADKLAAEVAEAEKRGPTAPSAPSPSPTPITPAA